MNLYGIFGDPVAHSLSPVMHNAAFGHLGLAARYDAYRAATATEFRRIFVERGLAGASVTIPLKEEVMTVLDDIEADAQAIGAVNTVKAEGGRLRGFNTDWLGIVLSLKEVTDIEGKTVAVVGAGGTARAALYGLMRHGGRPVVINRSRHRGESLAAAFDCPFRPLDEIGEVKADILIHTTPVGMHPHRDLSLLDRRTLRRFAWVMDVIYRPPVTTLLMEAASGGCGIISGVTMFVLQGAAQLRIWTGHQPPFEIMAQTVMQQLQEGG
ncbi:MAG: shikimate dehydrogenase [Syntrophales bacterium]|nr:shikimate dehydrogenase [Syntrophales bacterium]